MKNILFLFAVLLLAACGNNENQSTIENVSKNENQLTLTPEQMKSFTLSTVGLEERNISQTLKLNGSIDVPPQNMVSVSQAMGGYVKSIKLLPGMHFNKGDVLAVMEDNQYIQLQQDYLTAKAQLQNALAEYNRQKDLNESKASSDKVYQQAKADYESLLISQKALEQKLRLIHINPEKVAVNNIAMTVNIYAPFSGYVTKVFVNTGKYVAPSDVLLELVDPSDIHLNLKVFENNWDKLKIGQPLVAYTNSNPDKKHPGEIILIGKDISADRAVEIHAHLDKYDPMLIPGMYMNADLDIPDAKGWALREECIQIFEGKNYVFIQRDENHFEMMPVETGVGGNGWIAILNYQQLEGLKIVKDGAYTLLMSLKNEGED